MRNDCFLLGKLTGLHPVEKEVKSLRTYRAARHQLVISIDGRIAFAQVNQRRGINDESRHLGSVYRIVDASEEKRSGCPRSR